MGCEGAGPDVVVGGTPRAARADRGQGGVVGERARPRGARAGQADGRDAVRAAARRAHARRARRDGGDRRLGHPDRRGDHAGGRRRGHRVRHGGRPDPAHPREHARGRGRAAEPVRGPAPRHRAEHPAVRGPGQQEPHAHGAHPGRTARGARRRARLRPGPIPPRLAAPARHARLRQPLHRGVPRRAGPRVALPALRVAGGRQQDRPAPHPRRPRPRAGPRRVAARPGPGLPPGGHGRARPVHRRDDLGPGLRAPTAPR